jgi:DNA-binding protein H-NS
MAQTYKQIQKQIEQLQRQANALRNSEIKGVVERIKVAIAHYGLTAAQLGLASRPIDAKPRRTTPKPVRDTGFGDGHGNAWSGRGPRPRWLREALEAGQSIDEFRLESTDRAAVASEAQPKKASKVVKKSKRAPSTVLYRDDAGHSWTGRGPKPGWLKAALDAGKSLQDLQK